VPYACGCAVIWLLSSRPVPSWTAPFLFEGGDKIIHAGVYGLLAVAARHGAATLWRGRYRELAAWTMAVVYGAIDEAHQGFVPGRSPDGADLLADAIGAGLGLLVRGRLQQLTARRRPDP
jgi:VanZ family protein